ncbi:hypothetical protein CTEN210_17906 [Chaetoceros tenuissimus]|uniref:Sirohydrochlorin cobaltochelatase n=1 Tax=Chaetoceros tenuissimus TaxID=426638 RepID=A0AAD3HF75_9STRA|nr:hypothetical protein CTEN210_17906 [Chaetoceros tenuissimus]
MIAFKRQKFHLVLLLFSSLFQSSSSFLQAISSNRKIISLNKPLTAQVSDDDFDPLLSPHAYPNGTGSPAAKKEESTDDDWSPMKMSSVKDDFQGAEAEEYGVLKASFSSKWSAVSGTSSAHSDVQEIVEGKEEPAEFFDPLLSPHAYPKGTKAGPIASSEKQSKKQQVGILLIDHGSKRATSNARLDTLCEMYQKSPSTPSHYTIKAAHMEIAEPSIKQQIEAFYQEGVTKIVCHPYFLSPGRHVLEDIPELIEEAEIYMKEKYGKNNDTYKMEVIMTEAVGSKLDLMIGLIGQMVTEVLGEEDKDQYYESGFVPKDKSDPMALGGFFGEVQRMLDEQLD